MKKRTKFSLRTKIYLAIVGLFTLTGVLYAANPIFFNAFPMPRAWPLTRSHLYSSGWCDK